MRRGLHRRRLRCALACCLLGAPVAAQTSDPAFRSWEWDLEPHSVRSAGLAGALSAEAGEASSAVSYPAGLSLLSETDLHVSVRYAGGGDIGADATRARWALGEVTAARPIGLRWGVGVYHHAQRRLRLNLGEVALPDGSQDAGQLAADADETGVGVGYALAPRWRLGARVGLARLRLDADSETTQADAAARTVATSIDAYEPRIGVGLLFASDQRLQLGLNWASRTRWAGHLTADGGGVGWQLTAPSRLSFGVLYRPSGIVLMLGQVDRVGWSGVREALVGAPGRPAREAFDLGDATEVRLGLELQPQYGELGVWARPALRLGWRLRSRGLLDYAGDDTVEQARFPGAGKSHEWSVGAALGPFEVAWISREPAGVWLLGVQHVF